VIFARSRPLPPGFGRRAVKVDRSWFSRLANFCLRGSLWLVSAGLMFASSGLDGAYLTRLMPAHMFVLGYVLNTMADLASEIMMYWFGRLRLLRKDDKRARWSWAILAAEALLVAYAWFFSWRQLLLVLPAVESASDVRWVAPIAAGFIPLALVAVGYTQALLAGRIEDAGTAQTSAIGNTGATQETQGEPQASQTKRKGNGHAALTCPFCGATANASGESFANKQAVSAHMRFCNAYQAQRSPQAVTDAAQEEG